jgi:hypothetical protein
MIAEKKMNPQIQNQNDKNSDYDFIVNQPGEFDKPKPDRKVITIIILVIIIVITLAVAALLSAKRKVAPIQNSNPPLLAKTGNGSSTVADSVIKPFLVDASKNPQAAYDKYIEPGIDDSFTKEAFISESMPFLKKLKLSGCVLGAAKEVDTSGANITTLVCPTKSTGARIGLSFITVGLSTTTKIVNFSFVEPA